MITVHFLVHTSTALSKDYDKWQINMPKQDGKYTQSLNLPLIGDIQTMVSTKAL